VVTVAPRLFFRLTDGSGELPLGPGVWGDTRLEIPIEATAYRDVLSGAFLVTAQSEGQPFLRLATVLASFPVALLVSTGAG
jgi:maltooligosyltrehalose synthase